MNKKIGRRTDDWVDGINEWMSWWVDRCTTGWANGPTDGRLDGCINLKTEGGTEGQWTD